MNHINDMMWKYFKKARWPVNFEGGPETVGKSAVEITFSNKVTRFQIRADGLNLGSIYIGKSNITSAGANAIDKLDPGQVFEQAYDYEGENFWMVASEAGSKVYKYGGYID